MRRLRNIGTLGLLDLRLVVADRASLFWTFILPIVLMWVFGNAFGGSGDRDRPRVSLGVALEDEGFLGALFAEELRGESVDLQWKSGRPADRGLDEEATAGTDSVTAPRILTIPADFTARVLAGTPVDVLIASNEDANDRYDQMAEIRVWQATIAFLGNLLSTERELGVRLVRETEDGADDATGVDAAAAVPPIVLPEGVTPDRIVERYRTTREEGHLVTVSASDAGKGQAVPMGFSQSVPGILTQSILMMTIIYGAVFLALEKASGALKRQATLPVSRADILAGKLWGRLLLALLQASLLIGAGSLLFGAHWGTSQAGLTILIFCFCTCCAAFGLLGGALFRSPEQAGSIGWIFPLVMAALGGCWWPIEIVPEWMQIAGHVSPAAWAMDGFHALISFGRGVDAIMLPSMVLLGFATGAMALGARLLRFE